MENLNHAITTVTICGQGSNAGECQGSGGAGSGGTPGRLIASQMNNGTKYRGEGLALAFYGTVGVRELLQFRM